VKSEAEVALKTCLGSFAEQLRLTRSSQKDQHLGVSISFWAEGQEGKRKQAPLCIKSFTAISQRDE
jgi:hypothetical protein